MVPLISIRQINAQRVYLPGDLLVCQYQIDAVDAEDLQAVEASVLWYTEGKGDEDLGVHFFQRRTRIDAAESDLRHMHQFQTNLPRSPLSYSGYLFRIVWCVRVRIFVRGGKSFVSEQPFQLGPLRVGVRL